MAASLPNGNLIVPVIKNADEKKPPGGGFTIPISDDRGSGGVQRWLRASTIGHEADASEADDQHDPSGWFGGGRHRDERVGEEVDRAAEELRTGLAAALEHVDHLELASIERARANECNASFSSPSSSAPGTKPSNADNAQHAPSMATTQRRTIRGAEAPSTTEAGYKHRAQGV